MPTAFINTAIAWEIRRALNPFRELQSRREETQFYRRLIPKDGGCIIDVGANGGSKTEIFRALAARVIAIEPDPVSAGLLRSASGGVLALSFDNVLSPISRERYHSTSLRPDQHSTRLTEIGPGP